MANQFIGLSSVRHKFEWHARCNVKRFEMVFGAFIIDTKTILYEYVCDSKTKKLFSLHHDANDATLEKTD